jgi:hypothetical protein
MARRLRKRRAVFMLRHPHVTPVQTTLPPPDLQPPEVPPPLPGRQQRLLHRIEKAGIRASLRAGHPLSREELLDVEVQVMPLATRLLFVALAFGATWASYTLYSAGQIAWCIGFGFTAVLLLLFAIFGVRRTLSDIFDNMDANTAYELSELAIRAIAALAKAANR